jgi:hypothetical protein
LELAEMVVQVEVEALEVLWLDLKIIQLQVGRFII